MGTRGLTVVVHEGEYKVGQYSQFDSYPEGQGATILEFLRDKMDREKFIKRLDDCYFIDDDKQSALWKEAGADGSGMVNMEVSDKFKSIYPQLHREMGGDVLEFIQNSTGKVMLVDSMDFAQDSLFCEWAYVLDLDKNVLEVYEGFNNNPVDTDARFVGEPTIVSDTEYHPIKLVKTYSLDNLPDEKTFIQDLDSPDIDFSEDAILAVIDNIKKHDNGDEDGLISDRICDYIEANIAEFIKCYEAADVE